MLSKRQRCDYSILKQHISDYGDIKWKNTVSYVTYKRTYARRLNDDDNESETEELGQTLFRIIKSCNEQLGMKLSPKEQCEYFDIFVRFKALPAGRFLWQLGTRTVEKYGLLSLQNCAFVEVDHYESFCWAFDCLMLGSGVGYNIQRKYTDKLPVPKYVTVIRQDTTDANFIVPDSREGWIELLRHLFGSHFDEDFYTCRDFTYSTACLRSKGAPIKGFGGTASGPEHLCAGVTDINKIINSRAEKNLRLRPIDCLDVMNIIARTVISGNVRRSAQIAIGDHDDMEFLNAKRWDKGNIPNWRCFSNNSVVCDDVKKLPEEFWEGYKGNGECYGLINLNLSQKIGRTGETKYPDPRATGYNPSLRAGTRVLTSDGVFAIETLENKFFKIRNIKGGWSYARCWKSGVDKPLHRLTLSNSKEYYCTAEHKWPILTDIQKRPPFNNATTAVTRTATSDIKAGDKLSYVKSGVLCYPVNAIGTYTDGFCIGLLYSSPLGFINKQDYIWCFHENVKEEFSKILVTWMSEIDCAAIRINSQTVEDKTTNVSEEFSMYTLKSNDFSEYMNKFGIPEVSDGADRRRGLPQAMWSGTEDFRRGFLDAAYSLNGNVDVKQGIGQIVSNNSTYINDLWDLVGFYGVMSVVRQQDNVTILEFDANLFSQLFKITDADKQAALNTIEHKKVSCTGEIAIFKCEPTDLKEDVWDVAVYDDDHAFSLSHCVTGNCGEQSLEDNETCCLMELFLPNIDSQKELLKCAKAVYRIAKHSMSLPCHQKKTEAVVHKNMRMGIGVTGVLQAPEKMDWLDKTYKQLRQFDKKYSAAHNFPPSIKLTTVKPSGCVDPSTLIITNSGPKTLEQIFKEQGITVSDNEHSKKQWYNIGVPLKVVDENNNFQNVTKLYDNGMEEMVLIKIDGDSVVCTLDHKFKIIDGVNEKWVKAIDLRTGDVIKGY